jgi:hypothetical protein
MSGELPGEVTVSLLVVHAPNHVAGVVSRNQANGFLFGALYGAYLTAAAGAHAQGPEGGLLYQARQPAGWHR